MANEPTPAMMQLTSDASEEIDALLSSFEAGNINVGEWEESMQNLLVSYHLASWMTGQNSGVMDPDDFVSAGASIQPELVYLANFALVIGSAVEFSQSWYARARMYANAFTRTFWGGLLKGIPVPAMPAQGTQCFSNCRCSWRIDVLDADGVVIASFSVSRDNQMQTTSPTGDYNCYWELDPFVAEGEHCQTCLQRNDDWNPVLIRGGVLQV